MSKETIPEVMTLVERALAMTVAMRSKDPRTHLFDYADKQLQIMRDILSQNRSPTDEEKQRINVGRMAIHEFEGGKYDDYAGILEEADGAFYSL